MSCKTVARSTTPINWRLSQKREASDEAEYAEPSLVRLAVCRIGEQLYAMPADGLKQVCKVESVAYVPDVESVIAGLIQVGGEILGAVDLAEASSVEALRLPQRICDDLRVW